MQLYAMSLYSLPVYVSVCIVRAWVMSNTANILVKKAIVSNAHVIIPLLLCDKKF